MSNEEKKAIEYLKRHIMPYENEDGNIEFLINDVLLNLIIKQQNKIEAQEMEHQYDQKMIDDLKGEMVHNWLHKDIIREKIKEYQEIADEDNPEIYIKIDAYEELLEENK